MIIKILNDDSNEFKNYKKETLMDDIIKLRHKILREGFDVSEVMFKEDYLSSTRHYIILNEEMVTACLTLMKSEFDDKNIWRLRAMAVDVYSQNKGVGSTLMNYMINDLEKENLMDSIWLNSRTSAEDFYKKFKFIRVSDVFKFGNAGDSIKMVRGI